MASGSKNASKLKNSPDQVCKSIAIILSTLGLIKFPLFLILVAIENRKLGRHKKMGKRFHSKFLQQFSPLVRKFRL
jgi:hypothetical protein